MTNNGKTSPPSPRSPTLPWHDPNLRFIDLDGDGHADVLITEDEIFTWHASLGEDGFGPAQHTRKPLDEEKARTWSSPMARSPSTSPTCPAMA